MPLAEGLPMGWQILSQGASCVAPGKLGLDACGEGERVIALESW